MLFTPESKKVIVGDLSIGTVELESFRYITLPESKFIEDFQLLQKPIEDEVMEYAKTISPKIKEPVGDIVDSFYYNTTNSKNVRKKLIEFNSEKYNFILEKLQKVTDQNSALRPYVMLNFRSTDDVKSKIKEFLPEDLLIPGKVLTKSLLVELIHFYKCESDGVEYTYLKDRSINSENFI
jgi:hypothetical protein